MHTERVAELQMRGPYCRFIEFARLENRQQFAVAMRDKVVKRYLGPI